jgi:hypothetical protein
MTTQPTNMTSSTPAAKQEIEGLRGVLRLASLDNKLRENRPASIPTIDSVLEGGQNVNHSHALK